MAVINSPYVGDARGKLGAAVYLRAKGQTLVRGYNPSPLNRRTTSQQSQRAVFSSAVRFYSRGVQNLFTFAFEDRRTKESDYNAFMRYNAKMGPYFGPEQNSNDAYPALAPFIMTRGSLQGKIIHWNITPYVVFGYMSSDPGSTVAGISRAIINSDSNYQEGDILTFVYINTWRAPGSPSDPYSTQQDEEPEWTIMQLILDTSDTTVLSSPYWRISYDSGEGLRLFGTGTGQGGSFCSGAAFVHSRIRDGKVLVSDSVLSLNQYGNLAYDYSRSETWYNKVMLAWGAEQESILQGAVAIRQRPTTIEVFTSFDPPISLEDLTVSDYIAIDGNISASDLAQGLRVYNEDGDIADVGISGDTVSLIWGSGSSQYGCTWSYVRTSNVTTLLYLTGENRGAIQSVSYANS